MEAEGVGQEGFEMDAKWGLKIMHEIELDLKRAFSETTTKINTVEGQAALRRYPSI